MAIYHCQIKIGSRRTGKSAVASAAYRAGEKLVDERTGETADYTHKRGVILSEISLPPHVYQAHPEFADRSTLWNAVEKTEKRSDSRLYREFEVALPIELSREQQIALIRDFTRKLVDDGMAVDWSLHDPQKAVRNPHAHIMTPARAFDRSGEWSKKTSTAYALDGEGNKIPIIDPKTGMQKTRIRAGKGEEKLWVREAVSKSSWDERERVDLWRQEWESCVNRALKNAGHDDHIDHRSLKDQGVDREPQIHTGAAASKPITGSDAEEIKASYDVLLTTMTTASTMMTNTRYAQGIWEKCENLIEKIKNTIMDIRKKGVTRLAKNKLILARNECRDLIEQKLKSLENEIQDLEKKEKDRPMVNNQNSQSAIIGIDYVTEGSIKSNTHRRRR